MDVEPHIEDMRNSKEHIIAYVGELFFKPTGESEVDEAVRRANPLSSFERRMETETFIDHKQAGRGSWPNIVFSKYHISALTQNVDGEAIKVPLDVYAVQNELKQTPQVQHSFKKLWAAGFRIGGKDYRQDIQEAYDQLGMELARIDKEASLK